MLKPMVSLGLIFVGAGVAYGQNFPDRSIRVITGEAGGGSDVATRLIAPGLSESLGQQVVVDNRAGSAAIPGALLMNASPDGYTMLLYGATVWRFPILQENLLYDVARDFAPITLPISTPNVLVVHPSMPAKSVKELIAYAKARPGKLNYAAGPVGAASHFAGELFNAKAGVKIVGIPYKGGSASLNSLMGGEVQLMFASASAVVPHTRSGRLRALAVTSAQPSALLPELPAIAATLPGYQINNSYGIFAPANTPDALINRLNREIVRVLNRADLKDTFFNAGLEVVGNSPAEFAAEIKSEIATLLKLARDVGIRAK